MLCKLCLILRSPNLTEDGAINCAAVPTGNGIECSTHASAIVNIQLNAALIRLKLLDDKRIDISSRNFA